MALCTNTCREDSMVPHNYTECIPSYLGDSYSIAYILCDAANDVLKTDYTDATGWNTILAGANPQNDLVIANGVVVGRTSENVTTENKRKNGIENIKSGENFTLTITDTNVNCDNYAFYNAIDRRFAWVAIAYSDGRMEVSPIPFYLMSKSPQIVNGEAQEFTIEATRKFNNGQQWLCFDTQPVGIFTY